MPLSFVYKRQISAIPLRSLRSRTTLATPGYHLLLLRHREEMVFTWGADPASRISHPGYCLGLLGFYFFSSDLPFSFEKESHYVGQVGLELTI